MGEFANINPTVQIQRGKEYPFLDMADVAPLSRTTNWQKRKVFKGSGARFEENDTLFARITPCLENGKITQAQELKSPAFGSTEFYVLRGKQGISNSDFIHYLSRTFRIRKLAEGSMVGASGRQRVERAAFENIEVEVPENLETQKRIADILSAFDDKIELNNKISKNLEATAQAIFKEWFVNFKFPGHEKIKMVDSELGKIPEGWEVKKLADIVGLDKGISYKGSGLNKSGMPMINLGCFMRGGKFSYDNLKYYSGDYKPRHIAEIGDLLVSNTDITQEREIIGNPVIVEEWLGNKKYLFTHHIYILRPKSDLNKTFLYYLLRQSAFRARVIGAAAGTNILGLSKEAISSFEIIIPPAELVEKFTAMASQILEKISSIKHENQKLSALRDLLLPKLMSGEIKI